MVKEAIAYGRGKLNGHSKQVLLGSVLAVAGWFATVWAQNVNVQCAEVPPLKQRVTDGLQSASDDRQAIKELITVRGLMADGEWSNQRVWNGEFWRDIREQREDQKVMLDLVRELYRDVKEIKANP